MKELYLDPLADQLRHRPFPELAEALRSQAGEAASQWEKLVREAMPQMDRLTFEELRDSVPETLGAMAEAVESEDPDAIAALVDQAPMRGLARFHQRYEVFEVMQEDRLLRGVIVYQVEQALGRQMNVAEAAALHATIDVMLQRSVVKLVEEQKAKLREANESELKYLSFLSHDLHNSLGGISLTLQVVGQELSGHPQFAESAKLLSRAEATIADTINGMRRLLEHEQLRKAGKERPAERVDLNALVARIAAHHEAEAGQKGVGLSVDVEPDMVVQGNADLVRLVLQNLIGNAVKFSEGGTVRIAARHDRGDERQQCVVSVADEGPGIAPERLDRIFEAFDRGGTMGEGGVGLGLSIASRAAKLLGSRVNVESRPGEGSVFSIELPGC